MRRAASVPGRVRGTCIAAPTCRASISSAGSPSALGQSRGSVLCVALRTGRRTVSASTVRAGASNSRRGVRARCPSRLSASVAASRLICSRPPPSRAGSVEPMRSCAGDAVRRALGGTGCRSGFFSTGMATGAESVGSGSISICASRIEAHLPWIMSSPFLAGVPMTPAICSLPISGVMPRSRLASTGRLRRLDIRLPGSRVRPLPYVGRKGGQKRWQEELS